MTLFEQYHNLTGQEINPNKSCFIVGRGDKIDNIKAITKFQQNYLPVPYMGCPIYLGAAKRRLSTTVIEMMQQKLKGWNGKILSVGGKLTLCNNPPFCLYG